ncbi:MAG: ABC transporter permease [Nanoarchaeota archaeon]|nr:ABC transporter permease [Nanoarchaeota archaeon]
MILDYFSFSLHGLRQRKLRSWLTMIGIFIGIAAVVSLIGLGEGLRLAIISQFGFLGSDVLSVQAKGLGYAGPPGTAVTNPLTDDLAAKIQKIPGVEAAINRYIRTGTMEFNDKQQIGWAMSVSSGENRKLMETMLNLKAEQGRLLKDGDGRKVLLGKDFNEEAMFGKPIRAGDRVLISGIKYEVVGILEKKGSFLIDGGVFINEEPLLQDFGDTGEVNIIGVKVRDPDRIDQVKEDIEKLLRRERKVKVGEEDFEVQSPQQTLEALNSALFAVQLFVYIIAGISLIVGGIGISNTMYTAVLERTKEIGIQKAIGAKNSMIFAIFAIESGMLGMVGGIVGIAIGAGLAYGGAFFMRRALGAGIFQASVGPGLVLGALFFSFIIGMVAGLLPAYAASKMQPVDALRFAK